LREGIDSRVAAGAALDRFARRNIPALRDYAFTRARALVRRLLGFAMIDAALTSPNQLAPDEPLDERIARHLVEVINRTPVSASPFDHMVLESLWPARDYATLIGALPADAFYRELKHSDAMLPDGRSARLQFPLLPENIRRLPKGPREIWMAVMQAVTEPRVIEAWKMRFGPALEKVAGKPASRIRLRPYATLFRDIGGYKISIHPDSPRKAITTQYYLPADDSQAHLGTVFHALRADGCCEVAKTMRFGANTGYAFAVSPISYHSVSPMQATDRPRNSLMVIISYDRGPLVEGVKSAQKRLRAWYDRVRGVESTEAGEGKYETM
jgi:hypothetical protein